MTEAELIDVTRAMLRVAFIMSLPTLGVALAVGLVVGLLQALTSVQEMTLTFVPKLAAVGAAFWVTMGFMGQSLLDLWTGTLLPLVGGG